LTDSSGGCRKGKRDCAYPESSSSSSRASRRESRAKGHASEDGSTPSGDEDDGDEKHKLSTIPDDDEDADGDADDVEPDSAVSQLSSVSSWSQTNTELETPQRQTRPQPSRTSSKQSIQPGVFQHRLWSKLDREDKTYLVYHREQLSHHHYAFKYDAGDFLKTTFLEIAMNDQSQALLYAIIAFSAYHHSIEKVDPNISIFLQYYNKSIVLLQQSLKSKKPGIATLLTILQLATIEVRHKYCL
jgi:hypothetical protein